LIKGGVNISPIAVENALRDAFPEILATYVVGIQHDRWGEEVCAAVIFQPFIEDQKRAADHIVATGQMGRIANLSTYEAPARIMAITAEDLPLTSTGKVQRSVLRKKIQDRLNREGK
ncbi:MAG: hypothetical protein O3B73_05955, partial [bacterium]|nr:hypothetical protein [bacterium]